MCVKISSLCGNVNNVLFSAVLDTGSPISFVKKSCVPNTIAITEPLDKDRVFCGINASRLEIFGSFEYQMRINSIDATVKLFVVSDSTMQAEIILGGDFIGRNQLTVTLLGDRVLLAKVSDTSSYQAKNSEDENNIFLIDTNIMGDSLPELRVNNYIDHSVRNQMLYNFQANYVDPIRPAEPEVQYKMKIYLTTEGKKPFYTQPRRLGYVEKREVEVIIQDLLERAS